MKLALPLVAVLSLTTLAACGGSSAPSAQPSAAAPVVQPCDFLDVASVAKVLGSGLKPNTGTTDSPRCTLSPTTKRKPVFDLNYTWWFTGGLADAWQTMNVKSGTVSDVTIPGADAAKFVVQKTDQAYFVTGFVQTGNLITVVNGDAPQPYDARRTHAAALEIMRQIAKNAPRSAS